jgi:acetyl esterase/lipase
MRLVRRLTILLLSAALAACRTPQAAIAQEPPKPVAMVYRQVDGHDLHAYVFRPSAGAPKGPRGAILLFHGGGWSAGSAEWTFPAAEGFAAAGLVAIPIEYRLSEGTVTPIEALVDVCAAFRWARASAGELGIDPKRVAGYGVSAGAHLVASAATVGCPAAGGPERATPDALLLLSPPLDLARDEWFHGLLQKRMTATAFSPAEHVSASTPPTNIIIGAKDTLTPLTGAKLFCDRLNGAGGECHLNVFENVGHLLTRNLKNQESDYDPDPAARAAGFKSHLRLLAKLGFIDKQTAE